MSKQQRLADLIRESVDDHMTVYMAGFSHLIPFAAGHEMIRQNLQHLTLCRATPDLLYDQLIAAELADRLVFSYAGNPGVGLLPAFRQAVETGRLALDEYTHAEMICRLEAGAAGLPFWPLAAEDNDLSRLRGRPRVACPFTGQAVAVVPALNPDVAVLHVQMADDEGNLYVWGLPGDIKEAALASAVIVATAEQVRPADSLRHLRDYLMIPGFRVKGVAEVPFGAHPSYATGLYERDTRLYQEWTQLAKTDEGRQAWLDDWVRGVPSHAAYLAKLGDSYLDALKTHEGGFDHAVSS